MVNIMMRSSSSMILRPPPVGDRQGGVFMMANPIHKSAKKLSLKKFIYFMGNNLNTGKCISVQYNI